MDCYLLGSIVSKYLIVIELIDGEASWRGRKIL